MNLTPRKTLLMRTHSRYSESRSSRSLTMPVSLTPRFSAFAFRRRANRSLNHNPSARLDLHCYPFDGLRRRWHRLRTDRCWNRWRNCQVPSGRTVRSHGHSEQDREGWKLQLGPMVSHVCVFACSLSLTAILLPCRYM